MQNYETNQFMMKSLHVTCTLHDFSDLRAGLDLFTLYAVCSENFDRTVNNTGTDCEKQVVQ
jgi:hypothetical protein